MRTITALLILSVLVGCAATRTYQVSVKNETGGPITMGLVKEGGPFEPEWASPEDAAIAGQQPSPRMWAAIPDQRSADTGPVTGKFSSGSMAVLRVYQGKLNLPGILAISRGQPDRLDLPLHPGINQFTIYDQGGRFTTERADNPPAGQQP